MPCGDRVQVLLRGQKAEIHLWSLNHERTIRQSLESIKNQCLLEDNPQETAIVLLDSGSTDRTKEIAEEFVNFIVDTSPYDEMRAREYGLYSSKADIVISFSPRVVYPKGVAARLVKPMLDNPDIVVTSGHIMNDFFGGIADTIFTKRYRPEITGVRRQIFVDNGVDIVNFVNFVPNENFSFLPKAVAQVI